MELRTIKVSDEAYRMLKALSARTGEKMYALVLRLLRTETARLDKRGQ